MAAAIPSGILSEYRQASELRNDQIKIQQMDIQTQDQLKQMDKYGKRSQGSTQGTLGLGDIGAILGPLSFADWAKNTTNSYVRNSSQNWINSIQQQLLGGRGVNTYDTPLGY